MIAYQWYQRYKYSIKWRVMTEYSVHIWSLLLNLRCFDKFQRKCDEIVIGWANVYGQNISILQLYPMKCLHSWHIIRWCFFKPFLYFQTNIVFTFTHIYIQVLNIQIKSNEKINSTHIFMFLGLWTCWNAIIKFESFLNFIWLQKC